MHSRFFRRSRAVVTGLALCGAVTAAVLPATSGAAFAAQVPSTGATATATATDFYYNFSAESDGLYLDVQGGSGAKGALVVQWLPTDTASEAWVVGSGWQIRNLNSGMCLTTDGVAGDQLYQWPCRRSLAWYQRWTVLQLSDGAVQIINRHFGLYVDVYQNNTTLGGPSTPGPATRGSRTSNSQ